jgi:phosphatidate cytidylyltransferase
MIYDPLGNSLFVPTLLRVALIVIFLLAVALWRWRNETRLGHRSTMLTKMMTVIWVAPILVIALFCGGLILCLVVELVLLQALVEYAHLVELQIAYRAILTAYSFVSIIAASLGAPFAALSLLVLALFLTSTVVPIISGNVEGALRQIGAVIFGYLYIGVGLSSIIFIRHAASWGLAFLIVVGTAIALSDAGGFIVGKLAGGPRLAPRVSPMKTWSGAFGSLLGAAVGMSVQWPAISHRWTVGTILSLLIATTVGSIWGDLVESFIKRDFGEKDAGAMLRGFGGVLDRFDSFFVAIPLAYIVLLLATS